MTEPCSDLIDIAGVAELLDVTPASARTLIGRSASSSHPFPIPCVRLGGRPGWVRADIETWIDGRPGAGRGPRPGRRLSDDQRLEALAKGRTYLSSGAMAKFMRVSLEELEKMPARRKPLAITTGAYTRYPVAHIRTWLEKVAA